MQTAEIFATALEYPKPKIRRTDLLLPEAKHRSSFANWPRINTPNNLLFRPRPQLDDLIAAGLGSKHHVTSLKKPGSRCWSSNAFLRRAANSCGWPPKLLRKAGK